MVRPYEERATHVEFAAFKARWEANDRTLPLESTDGREVFTVDRLWDGFVEHLRRKHDARWLANNLRRVELALKPLRALYGFEDAATFSPLRLQAVRDRMIAGHGTEEASSSDGSEGASPPRKGRKLCRGEINERVQTVRRAFRWAMAHERVPAHLEHALAAVEPLRAGEFGVSEGRRVGPVDEATVWATLPY